MDYYNKLSKTTYNVLGGKDREKIISGIEEHKENIFTFKERDFRFITDLEGKEDEYVVAFNSVVEGTDDCFENIIAACGGNDDKEIWDVIIVQDDVKKLEENVKDFYFLELRHGTAVIGFCHFQRIPTKYLVIDCLFVRKSHRRKHFATWLLSIVEDISYLSLELTRRPIYVAFPSPSCYSEGELFYNMFCATVVELCTIDSGKDVAILCTAKVVVSISVMVGVLYPKKGFQYMNDFLELKSFIYASVMIEQSSNSAAIMATSRVCNLFLHGTPSFSNGNRYVTRTWLEGEDDELETTCNLLPLLLNDNDVSVPLSMIAIGGSWLEKINYIFHDGTLKIEMLRSFFLLYLNALSKSPKKYFNKKGSTTYKGFFQVKSNYNRKKKKIDTAELSKTIATLYEQYQHSTYDGTIDDLILYASFYEFAVTVISPQLSTEVVSLLFKRSDDGLQAGLHCLDDHDEISYRQWFLGNVVHRIADRGKNTLVLYEYDSSWYYLKLKEGTQDIQHAEHLAVASYNTRFEKFLYKQRFVGPKSYYFHEMYLDSSSTIGNIVDINATNYVEMESPYKTWMKQPTIFNVSTNPLVSVTFYTDWEWKDTVLDNLEELCIRFESKEACINMIDVANNAICSNKITFKNLVEYFRQQEHCAIYDQDSCDISLIPSLKSNMAAPGFVSNLDLIDLVWRLKKKPNMHRNIITSVQNCYKDFHIAMNGSVAWYYVVVGVKVFCLIEPTDVNMELYVSWKNNKTVTDSFLQTCDKSKVSFAVVGKNNTINIPPGYIYAIFTEEDTIAIGGNYFDLHHMTMHLKVVDIEDRLETLKTSRCPYFAELCIFTLSYVLQRKRYDFCSEYVNTIITLNNKCKQWVRIQHKNNYYFVRQIVWDQVLVANKLDNINDFFAEINTLVSESIQQPSVETHDKKGSEEAQTKSHDYYLRNEQTTRLDNNLKNTSKCNNNIGINFGAPLVKYPFIDIWEIEKESEELHCIYYTVPGVNSESCSIMDCEDKLKRNRYICMNDVDKICRTSKTEQEFSTEVIDFWCYWMCRFKSYTESMEYYVAPPSLYHLIKAKNFKYDNVLHLVPNDLYKKHILMIPFLNCDDEWELCVVIHPKLYVVNTEHCDKLQTSNSNNDCMDGGNEVMMDSEVTTDPCFLSNMGSPTSMLDTEVSVTGEKEDCQSVSNDSDNNVSESKKSVANDHTEKFEIIVFHRRPKEDHNKAVKAQLNNTTRCILKWLQHAWYTEHNSCLPIDEKTFDQKPFHVFEGTRYVPWIEGGPFICCIMIRIVTLLYERIKEAEFTFSMSDIITYVTNNIDDSGLGRVNDFREDLLLLLKAARKIQNRTLCETLKPSALDNYLQLCNVVEYGSKSSRSLNVISCIQNFEEMVAYSRYNDDIDDISDFQLVQTTLLKEMCTVECNKNKSQQVHMSNEFKMHDYSLEHYSKIALSKTIMHRFSNEYKDMVIDKYWKKLSKTQQKEYNKNDWKTYIHDNTQQCIDDAKKLLFDSYILDIQRLQEKIIEQHTFIKRKKRNTTMDVSTKYSHYVMELKLLLDHIINKATTHVADSINYITKLAKNRYGLLVNDKKINLMGIQEHEVVQKVVNRQFVMDNFEKNFIKKVDAAFDNLDGVASGWISLQQSDLGNDTNQASNPSTSEPLLLEGLDTIVEKYKNDSVTIMKRKQTEFPRQKILWVKCSFILDYEMKINATNKNGIVQALNDFDGTMSCITFDWYICLDDKNDAKHHYESISEFELKTCVPLDRIQYWKVQCVASFNLIQSGMSSFVVPKQLPEDDELDANYDSVIERRGSVGALNSFYFDVSDLERYYKFGQQPLCQFQYDSRSEVYYGMGKNCTSINEREVVTKEWLEENTCAGYMTRLHNSADQGKTNYLEVYPGAVGDVPDTYYTPSNPIIKYEQNEERACAFFSMASVLYYMGYEELSQIILNTRMEYFDTMLTESSMKQLSRKRKSCDTETIYKPWHHYIDDCMSKHRKTHQYKSMRIYSKFNILKGISILKEDEFVIASLKACDYDINHVVCFTRHYIFDSNAPNALTFSKEALDFICTCGFRELHCGYYYHHRSKKEVWEDYHKIYDL